MAGGIIQLVAYGIQDLYLTGDPQITYFKVLYRRHTNFAIESIIQNFTAAADFGEIVTCNLARAGDLIGTTFLHVELPAIPKFIDPLTGEEDPIKKFAWVRNLGAALIKEITIEIGGKLIDRQYGEFMYIWGQLTNRQNVGLAKMGANVPEMYEFTNGKPSYKLYIPITFWFCRERGLSLPVIALTSSDIKMTVTFRRLEECYRIGPTSSIKIKEDVVPFGPGSYIEQTVNGQTIYAYVIDYDYIEKKLYYIKIQNPDSKKSFESAPGNNIVCSKGGSFNIYDSITKKYCTPADGAKEMIEICNLPFKPRFVNSFFYVNYVYLDTNERLKFVRSNHEYLIDQVQYNQLLRVTSPNVKQNLTLNHPCKEHFWIAQLDMMVGPGTINDIFNFTNSHIRYPDGRLYGENLVENAVLLLNSRDRFGTRNQKYFNLVQPYQCHYRGPVKGINMYSFSLNPENHQPSGTCNMSMIDQISMIMKLNNVVNAQNTCKIRSYTINYNIFRVFFNLGGIAFVS